MSDLYSFVYRGVLTDASLDKVGRKKRLSLGPDDAERIREALSYELLDGELLVKAEMMALIYTAIHAFENSVRTFVHTAMAEAHQEEWWGKVSTRIQNRAKSRMDDEAKFRWHGARGGTEIEYCDFGDLSSIIVTNWDVFEDVLVDMEGIGGHIPYFA